jgi:hypothetical protein
VPGAQDQALSNAPAAQAVDVPGVQAAEVLAAFGTVVHIGFQEGVALALPLYPVMVGVPSIFEVKDSLHVGEDFRLAHFPVSIPSRPQAAVTAGCAVAPHNPV